MSKDLHEVQASILKELLFKNGSKFSSLNKLDLTNDHFTFHIKRLVEEEIIVKEGTKYFLTQKGKMFASRLDVDSLIMERQGSLSVAVTAKKVTKNKTYYLIQQRLKEPMYGFFGFVNGKIRFGEYSKDTAKRELYEETGLNGNPEILMVAHKLRGPDRNAIKLDHFFFLYIVKNPRGKLKDTKEGKNFWMPMEKIEKLRTFPGFDTYLSAVKGEKFVPYTERYIKIENI